MEMDPRIERFLSDPSRKDLGVRGIDKLAGDASERCYFRLALEGGSLVLALMPEPFEPDELPFLNVAHLLERVPVRIPRVHAVSGKEGILLVEDLGDDLLQSYLQSVSPAAKKEIYEEALTILVRLQKRGAELASDEYLPYRLAFDESKLRGELDFFARHFLCGLRRAKLGSEEIEELELSFSELACDLAARPRVLCHRDYHARNLIVCRGELAVVDFQDARLGPVSYDLVSLLRDSYVEHEDDFVADMRARFYSSAGLPGREDEFEPMSLQRNLKALGTFGYQIHVRHKDVYRRYVAPTLTMVERLLRSSPRWDPLRRALARHLPEIA